DRFLGCLPNDLAMLGYLSVCATWVAGWQPTPPYEPLGSRWAKWAAAATPCVTRTYTTPAATWLKCAHRRSNAGTTRTGRLDTCPAKLRHCTLLAMLPLY